MDEWNDDDPSDEEGFGVARGKEDAVHRPVDQVHVGRQGERRVPHFSGGLSASGMHLIGCDMNIFQFKLSKNMCRKLKSNLIMTICRA